MSDQTTRTRTHPIEGNPGGGGTVSDDTHRQELRERARRMLAIGSDIIDDALSGDSTRYLDRSRQRGGQ